MSIAYSPNMNLPVPGVGTEDGPAYATDINSCLSIIDQHSHISGSGVPITPDAIDINTSLTFQSNFATNLAGLTLIAQNSTPANNTVYESGNDLYFVDGLGNNVRITQSGGVAGSPGSISNLTSPASASYVSASSTFVWQSDANTAANMDGGSVLLRNITANSKALTLAPPNAMAANYSITLPSLPASQKFMTIDNSGTMSAPWAVDGSTIVVATNTVKVPTGGITTTQIASATIVGGNIASNINLPGDAVQEDGKNLVVSSTNATNSLAIIRGLVNADGSIGGGEGFSSVRIGLGNYTVTFSNSFSDTPVATVTIQGSAANVYSLANTSSSTLTVVTAIGGGTTRINEAFYFIAIGQR